MSSARNITTGMPKSEQVARQEAEFESDIRKRSELARMRAPRVRGGRRFRTGENAARALLNREED